MIMCRAIEEMRKEELIEVTKLSVEEIEDLG